ncbi:hypothetical protein GRX03_02860 [Halovenus sp. WSH3]|uniref:Ion transport domain-containing protein n=1 Tax=Halovenus carboxidivorans TaxID=2692199 RepID=A0A6B0TBH5_9EURY|nr:ion transporter [Halovenus carboxidivorans]MXR50549.1 hypothetical protein [Halovenus carboxidivorans]
MSSANGIWVKIDSKLKRLAPVFLLLLVVYLYSSLVSPVLSEQTLRYVEVTIITYYVFELVVKYIITDDYRQFLRDYWLDIVLIVPFFSSLRLLGAVGKALKSVKSLKYIKYIQKAIKIPKGLQKTRLCSEKSEQETDEETE